MHEANWCTGQLVGLNRTAHTSTSVRNVPIGLVVLFLCILTGQRVDSQKVLSTEHPEISAASQKILLDEQMRAAVDLAVAIEDEVRVIRARIEDLRRRGGSVEEAGVVEDPAGGWPWGEWMRHLAPQVEPSACERSDMEPAQSAVVAGGNEVARWRHYTASTWPYLSEIDRLKDQSRQGASKDEEELTVHEILAVVQKASLVGNQEVRAYAQQAFAELYSAKKERQATLRKQLSQELYAALSDTQAMAAIERAVIDRLEYQQVIEEVFLMTRVRNGPVDYFWVHAETQKRTYQTLGVDRPTLTADGRRIEYDEVTGDGRVIEPISLNDLEVA
jgi:hypothetical protein